MLKHPVNHVIEAARHLVCCINKFSATFTNRNKKKPIGLFFIPVRRLGCGEKSRGCAQCPVACDDGALFMFHSVHYFGNKMKSKRVLFCFFYSHYWIFVAIFLWLIFCLNRRKSKSLNCH